MSVTLHAMSCGTITLPEGFLLLGAGQAEMQIPVPAFVIRHPEGTVVFDTGLEKALGQPEEEATPPERALMRDLAAVSSSATIGVGEDIASRLAACEIDADRVDFLVNSHLHFDHSGGNAMIRNARLVVQRREWVAGTSDEGKAANHYHAYNYDLGHDRLEVDGEHDLFGDGTVVCIPSYGHTPGHQSLRVKLDDGEVVLTSDACALCRSLDEMRVPGAASPENHDTMLATFRMFKELQVRGAELVFGHDPGQWGLINDGTPTPLTASMVADARRAMGR